MYLVNVVAVGGLIDDRMFEELKEAENHYFRALAAVLQQNVVDVGLNADATGGRNADVRLQECYLYKVDTMEYELAQDRIANLNAVLMQTHNADRGFAPVTIEGLFFGKGNLANPRHRRKLANPDKTAR